MKDDAAAVHRPEDDVLIANVAADEFHVGGSGRAFEPAAVTRRPVMDERSNPTSKFEECFREMRADESTGTGHQDVFAAKVHDVPVSDRVGRIS